MRWDSFDFNEIVYRLMCLKSFEHLLVEFVVWESVCRIFCISVKFQSQCHSGICIAHTKFINGLRFFIVDFSNGQYPFKKLLPKSPIVLWPFNELREGKDPSSETQNVMKDAS